MAYSKEQWKSSRREARKILRNCAKISNDITYSDLAGQITSARFEASSILFWQLLGDISTREYKKGRGMLTVLVVHKGGDMKPGKAFFELARSLGIRGDDDKIWIDQWNFVIDYWKSK